MDVSKRYSDSAFKKKLKSPTTSTVTGGAVTVLNPLLKSKRPEAVTFKFFSETVNNLPSSPSSKTLAESPNIYTSFLLSNFRTPVAEKILRSEGLRFGDKTVGYKIIVSKSKNNPTYITWPSGFFGFSYSIETSFLST